MKKLLLITICALLVGSATAYSQSLDSTLQKLAGDAARGYVGPIVSGFGSDLNGGWFHKSPSAKMFGFDLEFGLVAMGTTFSEESKKFSASGSFKFDNNQAAQLVPLSIVPTSVTVSGQNVPLSATDRQSIQTQLINQIIGIEFGVGISGPTIIGSANDSMKIGFTGASKNATVTVFVPGVGNQQVIIPVNIPSQEVALPVGGLLDGVTLVPLAAPQLSLGTIVGTQFTFRYLPEVEIDSKIGKFKYFGWGLQHNPGIWFPNPLPINICASFFTQKLDVGTIFSTTATAYGINISKTFGPGALNITPYAGFMLESSKMTFTYDYDEPVPGTTVKTKNTITFELEGENKSRIILGLSLKLLFININADYNIAKYNSFTGGVMFII